MDELFGPDNKLKNPKDIRKSAVPWLITVAEWSAATVISCNAGKYVTINGAQIPNVTMPSEQIDLDSGMKMANKAFDAGVKYASNLFSKDNCCEECTQINVRIHCTFGAFYTWLWGLDEICKKEQIVKCHAE